MIPLFAVYMSKSVNEPLLEVLHSGYIGQGKKVDEFEEYLRTVFNHPHPVTLNSGTSALYLALQLAGVGHGDTVLTTAQTCMATNTPIILRGATPIWVDVDPDTGLLDPRDMVRKIQPDTKAVIGVDWGGTPCDWEAINHVAHKAGIATIQDSAHGLGMEYKGSNVPQADYTMMSLQAIKHVTSVDGGILWVRDKAQYERAKLLRWYGIDREGKRKDFRCEEDVAECGLKLHMNDINAVIGMENMKDLPVILAEHRDNAHRYIEELSTAYGFAYKTKYPSHSSFWLFTLLLPNVVVRNRFMQYMLDNGVQVSRVHARNDTHSCFAPYRVQLPNTDRFDGRQVSIPVHWKLSQDDVTRIITLCNTFALNNL